MARTPGQYQRIVDRAVRATRRRPEDPICIAKICRASGVSARTLLRAFRAVHGATPYRWLRLQRLIEARRILLSATGKPLTVTEVATRFGFVELGRFSVAYRSVFGESPSATLRRSSRCGHESSSRLASASPAIGASSQAKRWAVTCSAEEFATPSTPSKE